MVIVVEEIGGSWIGQYHYREAILDLMNGNLEYKIIAIQHEHERRATGVLCLDCGVTYYENTTLPVQT